MAVPISEYSPRGANKLRHLSRVLILGTTLVVSAIAWADLRGAIVNGTTRRPGAGDEVVLLSLSQEGMTEAARTTADARGRFSLPVADPQATHVVRVIHQGVTYHRVVETGVKAVAIEVYDVVQHLEGVRAIMDVQRFEATSDQLEVKQLITLRNESQPPRTLMNDRPFEIQLPSEARVQSGLVQVEDAQPLKQKPLAGEQKGQYYFVAPIRPGDTRFAVVYRLAYNGEALIEPNIRNPLEKFVVMLPKAMKFEPTVAGVFQPMPGTTPDNVQGTAPLRPDQVVAFRISGTGTLEELAGRRQEAQASKTDSSPRPGGGLGPPIDAPDPLQKYRLPILTGLSVLMAAGVVHVVRRIRLQGAKPYPRFGRQAPNGVARKQTSRRRMNRRHRQRAHV
jgi:hypothetical protein